MTAGGLLLRGISAVFRQTKRESGVFSTGTKKNDFTGFSGIGCKIGKGKGAHNGFIFPQGSDPLILGISDER